MRLKTTLIACAFLFAKSINLYSQPFNPSANKQETVKFIDNLLKKKVSDSPDLIQSISFTEAVYKVKELTTVRVYKNIPWEKVTKITRDSTIIWIDFSRELEFLQDNKKIKRSAIYMDMFSDETYLLLIDLELALNRLVTLRKQEKKALTLSK